MNLVFSVPLKTLPFSVFRRILGALRVECGTQRRVLHGYQSEEMKIFLFHLLFISLPRVGIVHNVRMLSYNGPNILNINIPIDTKWYVTLNDDFILQQVGHFYLYKQYNWVQIILSLSTPLPRIRVGRGNLVLKHSIHHVLEVPSCYMWVTALKKNIHDESIIFIFTNFQWTIRTQEGKVCEANKNTK